MGRKASTLSERTEHEKIYSSETDDGIATSGRTGCSISEADEPRHGLISQLFDNKVLSRTFDRDSKDLEEGLSADKQKLIGRFARSREQDQIDEYDDVQEATAGNVMLRGPSQHIEDFNMRLGFPGQQRRRISPSKSPSPSPSQSPSPEPEIPSISATPAKPHPGVVPNAFDRMRPMRTPRQTATITIGDKTTTTTIGSGALRMTRTSMNPKRQKIWPAPKDTPSSFSSSLRAFAAAGSQFDDDLDGDDEESIAHSTSSTTWGRTPSELPRGSSADRDDLEEPIARSYRSSTLGRSPSVHPHHNSSVAGYEEMNDVEDFANAFAEAEKPINEAHSEEQSEEDDGEWLDEEAKTAKEEARVARLIEEAEAKSAVLSRDHVARAQKLLKAGYKEATLKLTQTIDISIDKIDSQLKQLNKAIQDLGDLAAAEEETQDAISAEERLSLTVSKADFSRMRIIGQFNLGFILAVRPDENNNDELFIIDQHASDEKYNFERLQATTVVQNQRLVQPQFLELTAIEEELILDSQGPLERNGFVVSVDESGDLPVGHRCKLTSLPMSREVTFSSRDLEELLVLLNDSKDARPSKVRKMFAMRACRSSVMVGKNLTNKQMERLVRNMGTIDKPWNCPHGRPTMRHLFGLNKWEGWSKASGLAEVERGDQEIDWEGWMNKMEAPTVEGDEKQEEDEDEEMEEGGDRNEDEDEVSAVDDDHEEQMDNESIAA